jgi:potassium efflux system protein
MRSFSTPVFPSLAGAGAAFAAALRRVRLTGVAALLFAVFLALALPSHPAWAQPQDDAVRTTEQRLDDLRDQVSRIQSALKNEADLTDAALSRMKSEAQEASVEADKLSTELQPQLTSVQARLAELGKPVAGTKEAPDVAAQRLQLDRSVGSLDAQLKLARLLSVEADQASEQVSSVRRLELQARLGERTSSILAGQFWGQLNAELPQNLRRMGTLGTELGASARNTPPAAWAGLALAMLVVIVGLFVISRVLLKFTSTRVPHGRLRRSVHAVVVTLLAAITPALIAELLKLGFMWNSSLSTKTADVLNSAVGIIAFCGFAGGLGYVLLSPGKPSWRLPGLPDALALSMRHFPLVLAIAMFLSVAVDRIATLVNAGLSTAVAVNCIVVLLLGGTMALGLLRAGRVWRQTRHAEPEQVPVTPVWLKAAATVSWLALAVSFISVLAGYVAFGNFVTKQLSWVLVVACTAYLLAVLVNDVCMLLSSTPPDPNVADPVLPTPKARDQAAVLLSGAGRAAIFLLAIMVLLAPFGEGPAELFQRVGQLHDGWSIGEIQLRPGALIQSLAVLVCGFFGLRLLKQWLQRRYLPTTTLDQGMQVSALTLFGYAGGVIVISMALSSAGIGLERIAWVASALSVGIGFGLQAVVQNFVSGLILLAERPVKVGDWVSLGGVEGDIRRINVRATEIQMGDRSTVIVPNSEFITKTVRNITHASPLGLVQVKLPLPLDTDAEQARALILQAFIDNPDVLETPAPSVQLDGIDNGYLMFNATGFASSPRLTYGVRSALLFELLKRLKAATIPISKPSTMVLRSVPEALSQPVATAAPLPSAVAIAPAPAP